MFEVDELSIYRGRDIYITPKIIVTQPTLGQIEEFGEKKYFNAVYTITSTSADLKWQLWDYAGIDYTTVEDYELFVGYLYQLVSSSKAAYNKLLEENGKENDIPEELKETMLFNPLSLILKDIDFADFIPCKMEDSDDIVLYNEEKDITIDRVVYNQMVDVIRKIHGLKRNAQMPANERTKMDLIDDARDDALASKSKPFKSLLKPLISSVVAKCGLCGDDKIWNMKINQLFDTIRRMNKIQDATLLLQGAYSGFADLKGVDKTRFDWVGDI